MSFLSAIFLFALPLAAVPVAIHLYRGRQRDVIHWGAMQFLASAVTKGRSVERLEELLLMTLRLAAVAVLVLALARPMISSHWLGQGATDEVILVLDNSLSMSREVDGRSAAARLKERAKSAIDGLSSATSVQVLLAAGTEWATAEGVPASSAGKRRLHEIVDELEPTLGAADLVSCLQAAVHLQGAADQTSRRIIVFSDNQAANWKVEPASTWRQLAEARDRAPFPTTIEVVDCALSAGELDNLAVMKLDAAQKVLRPREKIELSAEVMNVGNMPSDATSLEWIVAGEVVQTSPIAALAPNEASQIAATLAIDEPGATLVTCRIERADQVPLDQEDAVVVEVADHVPILLVDDAEENGSSVSTAHLVAAALGYTDGEPQRWHSAFRPTVIDTAALAAQPLTDVRAMLIANLPELDRAVVERLDAFVRAGGGLWVGVGNRIDRDRFNHDWYGDGAGLSALPLRVVQRDKADDAAAFVHPPQRSHPATAQLANTTQLDIDEARISQSWRFAERDGSSGAVSALLEAGDGRPLVIENSVGRGRVLVQAFPMGMEWTNLPILKAYVVMIHDWLNHITAPTSSRFNLAPGGLIASAAPAGAHEAQATLVTPRGREAPLAAGGEDALSYRYSQTRLPGIYRLRFTSGGAAIGELPFHVERDASESIFEPIGEAQRALARDAGIRFDGDAAVELAAKSAPPPRAPAWSGLLAAFVALVACELVVASRLARHRHGSALSAV